MTITFSLLTISDTRDKSTDLSGKMIKELAEKKEWLCLGYQIVQDDHQQILNAYQSFKKNTSQIILTNGGTGIAKRDVTFQTLKNELVTEIPGFGELFRYLSYLDIGSHAMASRAIAGLNDKNQLVFCLPGSPKACELGMEKLILLEAQHLIHEITK